MGEEGDGGRLYTYRYTVTTFGFYVALRPRRRDDLLGTETEWEGVPCHHQNDLH